MRPLGSALIMVAFFAAFVVGCTPQKEYAINVPSSSNNPPNAPGSNSGQAPDGGGPAVQDSQPGQTSPAPSTGAPGVRPANPNPGGGPGTNPNPNPQGQGRPQGQGGQSGQRGFGMNRGGSFGLLRNTDVQSELKLTDDQKKKLDDLAQSMRPSGGQGGQGGQGGGQGERPDFQAMQERMKKAEEEVDKILKPDQAKRLEELRLQREGVAALARPEVAKELGLTDAQKKQMEDLQQKMMEKMREAFGNQNGGQGRGQGGPPPAGGENRGGGAPPSVGAPGGGGGGRPNFDEIRKMRDEINDKVIALLTPAQKSKWQQMQGKKFEFRQGGRGGPGGGAGGNSRFGA
ncbi:MAG: hypothetical protein JSS66_16935 [Armatimonadetes bacterium]|nr:hypothetical protein [Armatimonadota bacterium]